MIYLKNFDTDSDRIEYEDSENYLEPYVSYVEGDNSVHYNKPIETRVVAKFNVTDTTYNTPIASYYGGPKESTPDISEIEIDGVVQPTTKNEYLFETMGEHIVKYTLTDATAIPGYCFASCYNIVSMTIPNSVTSIGNSAFIACGSLTNITIPNSVTSISSNAFRNCTGLTNVTVEATTPPTLGSDAFNNNASGRKIFVPSESVETYKAASGWSTYAADIEAIP